MIRLMINIVGFYLGWFACVLGAASGFASIGPAVVMLLVFLHLKLNPPRRAELALMGIAFFLGLIVDSILVSSGIMVLAPDFMPAGITTFWMICMWVNFALTLNVSLRCLQGRPWLAALLGLLGGPAAYYTGERLGAITIPEPYWIHLVSIGVAWGLVTPLLAWSARKLKLRFAPAGILQGRMKIEGGVS